MSLVIPINTEEPHSDLEVVLDARTFTLEFRWNERAGAWFFSVYDAAGLLLAARKVVLGWRLLSRFRDPRLPYGDFVAYDTSRTGAEPGMGELGGRVLFMYITGAELDAEAAA